LQILSAQLKAHLKEELRALYTFHGDDVLLSQEASDQVRRKAGEMGYTDRHVFAVFGAHFDWSEVLASAGSQSLFADKQILEIRIASGKPGKEGSLALQKIAEQAVNSEGVLTMVHLPRADKAMKSTGWFSALESCGVSVLIESVPRHDTPTWIAGRLVAQGQRVQAGTAGERALKFFSERVEGNLLAAHQEIQKLALLYPEGELSTKQIESAVLDVARYDVFKITNAMLLGQGLRVQKMLDGLEAEGVSAVLVHHTIAEEIRSLRRVKEALDRSRPIGVALKEQRIWGEKETLYTSVLPGVRLIHLDLLVRDAHVVDGVIKGLKSPLWPTDPWQALHRLAQRLSSVCRGR
jgi:DNA polymerase III subunit delta